MLHFKNFLPPTTNIKKSPDHPSLPYNIFMYATVYFDDSRLDISFLNSKFQENVK